ncbi:MAG TPA: hypothetical protein VIW28_00640 [Gemmatimonadales bacterium]|jgi:hypothetical protein
MSTANERTQDWPRRWSRGILRIVRALFAFVPPWDFDELPVRHWWDVYAK